MQQAAVQARRATLDDLNQLRSLWSAAGLSSADLERRLTEFQIIERNGKIAACIGVRNVQSQGLIHSEAHAAAPLPGDRHLLAERVRALAGNHGWTRLWIRSTDAFWQEQQFTRPKEDAKAPTEFGADEGEMLALKLRDDPGAHFSLDHEFDLFIQSQRGLSEKAMRQARMFRVAAWIILCLAFVGLLVLGWYVYNWRTSRERPQPAPAMTEDRRPAQDTNSSPVSTRVTAPNNED